MINRVLIRIKVVQMLYSYLLTRSEFKIDDAPQSASRDRRYAYTAYIDLLLLLVELSGLPVRNGQRDVPFTANRFLKANNVGKALAATDAIRAAILRDNTGIAAFDSLIEPIMHKITASPVYDDYKKKAKHNLGEDVAFWTTVFETIITKDPDVIEAMRTNQDFTFQGYEMGVANMCATLRSYNDSRQLLVKAKSDLDKSLRKAYELYLGLLKLILDITDLQDRRLDNAKNKFIVTADDLNPNMRLADNALAQYLRDSQQFADLLKEYKVDLFNMDSPVVRYFLDQILASDLYAQYLQQPATDLVTDTDFWREVMRTIILPSERLDEELEDKSVFWNDDLNIMGSFVLKTLRHIGQSEGRRIELLPIYKDDDDRRFGPDLFMAAVDNSEQYRQYIDMFVNTSHWDPERVAYMDIVVMITAIAEIIKYPSIPVPVTINEYVEIANNYSTDKSGAFVNGVLFSVTKYLNEQGIIHKS